METVQLNIPQEDWKQHMTIEPAQTMWFDEYNVHLFSFIRIFYRHKKHVIQQIGKFPLQILIIFVTFYFLKKNIST